MGAAQGGRMALLTAPTSRVPAPPRVSPGGRLAARARSTPGRLTALMLLLAVLGLLAGTAGVVGVMQRSALVDGVRNGSGPLTVQAQQLYRSLSDADATVAAAFLSGGIEPEGLRTRYQRDIADASAALAAVTAGASADRDAVNHLAARLPVYAGLIDTARTYNRLGRPLGAAYRREASGLRRAELLPAAQSMYASETRQLRADRTGGASFPWLAIPLLVLTIAGLVWAQRYLTRRTHRLLNVGLVAATFLAVVMLGWTTVSWAAVQNHLDAGRRTGSEQVDLLVQARIAALTARADEALTLVARGSGGDFDKDFDARMATLAGADGKGGLLAQVRKAASDPTLAGAVGGAQGDAQTWLASHKKERDLDNGGSYPEAVKLAGGGGGDSTGGTFQRLRHRPGQANDPGQPAPGGLTAGAGRHARRLDHEAHRGQRPAQGRRRPEHQPFRVPEPRDRADRGLRHRRGPRGGQGHLRRPEQGAAHRDHVGPAHPVHRAGQGGHRRGHHDDELRPLDEGQLLQRVLRGR